MVGDLSPRNIDETLEGVDLILDATDNFETRYLINDFAVRGGIPWIYGAAVGSYGIKLAIVPGDHRMFPLRVSRASAAARNRPARPRAYWGR